MVFEGVNLPKKLLFLEMYEKWNITIINISGGPIKTFLRQNSVTCNHEEIEEKNKTFKASFKDNDKFNYT